MTDIRPYRGGDQQGIAALVDASTPPLYATLLHALHGPDEDGHRWKRTRMAVTPDGSVAGAVTLAHHSVHRGQYALVVGVTPGHRRQGVGRVLVAEARRMRPQPLPMVVRFFAADAATAALFRAEHGEVVQTAPNTRLAPAELRFWADAQPVPVGATVGSLAGVPLDEVARAWTDAYVWQHEGWTWPPISMPALARYAEITARDTDRELSAGAWVGGRLAAIALAIDTDGETTLVTETVRRDEPDGVALVAAVLAEALRRLADRGVGDVLLDGHVTDPHLHPVTGTFPAGLRTDPILVGRID
jgi:GNAT superfamily N-acetyltransferase